MSDQREQVAGSNPADATTPTSQDKPFEPLIIGFTCNWCSYRAADLAGTSRIKYPPNVRLIRLMCSGRLDPLFVLKAFAGGADGVLITGCHPGECHYLEQNFKAYRRYRLLQRMVSQFGIEPARVKLVWASAAEGVRLADQIAKMVEEIRALGPLNWAGVLYPNGDQAAALPVDAEDITDAVATPVALEEVTA
jgi:F420-non-reducing hydrogenase iron-sulfur subunit